MFKGYEATDEGLILFSQDFRRWVEELKTNPVRKLDYTFYFTHHIAVEAVFKQYSSELDNNGQKKKWKVDPVTVIEEQYMSLCFNGGLTYCEEYEGECYGYDYNSFYPRMLANETFSIPTKHGYEKYTDVKYHMENNTLQYGMYYVEIKSSNPHAKKIFGFSKHDVYTHYSIKFAYKHRVKYGFTFGFWSEEDGHNSFIYEDEDEDLPNCKSGRLFFGTWLQRLTDMRKLYPKNKLLKHLLSSLWGSLCRKRTIMKTYDQIVEEGLDVSCDNTGQYEILEHYFKDNGKDYYKLRNNLEPYHYGLARIKCFLVARGRNLTATLAMKNIDNVIRIHTDAVCFSQPVDVSHIENLMPENKTTGNLKWTKVNRQPIRLDD